MMRVVPSRYGIPKLVILLLLLLGLVGPVRGETQSDIERAKIYSFLATDLLDHSFCEKINPNSFEALSWAVQKGYQTWFLRSKCFFDLAIKAKHVLFCDRVIERRHWWYNGSKISPQGCKEEVLSGSNLHQVSVNFNRLLTLLGEKPTANSIAHYYSIRFLPRIRKRLSELPELP